MLLMFHTSHLQWDVEYNQSRSMLLILYIFLFFFFYWERGKPIITHLSISKTCIYVDFNIPTLYIFLFFFSFLKVEKYIIT
jgi:hypothetical protein